MVSTLILIIGMMPFYVWGKDCGVRGPVFPIVEPNLLHVIQNKLSKMSEGGEVDAMQSAMRERARHSVLNPVGTKLPWATQKTIHYHEPIASFDEDLKDAKGKVFYKAHTQMNALKVKPLSKQWVFFNGEREVEIAWIAKHLNKYKTLLIATQGRPIALSERLNTTVYFDQGGLLIKKLGIQATPSVISQDKYRLKIETVVLDE